MNRVATTNLNSPTKQCQQCAKTYRWHFDANNANKAKYVLLPVTDWQNSEIKNFLTKPWDLQQAGTVAWYRWDQCQSNLMLPTCILSIFQVCSPSNIHNHFNGLVYVYLHQLIHSFVSLIKEQSNMLVMVVSQKSPQRSPSKSLMPNKDPQTTGGRISN